MLLSQIVRALELVCWLVPLQGVASVVCDLVLIIYLKLKINLQFVFTKAAILSFDACLGVMPGMKFASSYPPELFNFRSNMEATGIVSFSTTVPQQQLPQHHNYDRNFSNTTTASVTTISNSSSTTLLQKQLPQHYNYKYKYNYTITTTALQLQLQLQL